MSKTKQDEFLALVAAKPLPWVFENYGEPLDYHLPHGIDEDPEYTLPHAEAHDLCSAAPAMATAILRLLQAEHEHSIALGRAMGARAAVMAGAPPGDGSLEQAHFAAAARCGELKDALRAALPEELR